MTLTVSDYAAVRAKAGELGCDLPSDRLLFLPDNFVTATAGEELRFHGEATTAIKILKNASIPVGRLGTANPAETFIHNRDSAWALPVIFVGAELLKTSPDLLTVALSAVQDYVAELFKGVGGKRTIKAEVVVEDKRKQQFKRISYEGDPEGLKELAEMVRRISRK